ncbi:hypothetical protein GGQ68_003084 [Sagittula marina]|uniref:YhdP central domain-containing protein n=1 Tax=Sagittula marina TaxID=943940 RepID=A0A7W6DS63_9RHOB|nr:hypothetical protein [Sagittula marina]
MSDDTLTEKPQKRRGRRALLWGLGVLVAMAGILVAGGWYMIGREVAAPPWLREKIEQRIAQSTPGIDIDFGRMSLRVESDGLARVILWDVALRNDLGVLVAEVNDVEAAIAPVSLLNRQWQLREARISGAFVTLQRDETGRIGLALGDAFAAGTQVPDIGQIIAQIDRMAEDPRLAQLDLFQADALTLRYEDLRAGRGWTADGGRLRVTRERQALRIAGDVALLSGGAGVATVELAASSKIGETAVDFGMTLDGLASNDIATQSPALAWLDALDAPISGSLRSSLGSDGALGEMRATLEIGAGVLQPRQETTPLKFDEARTAFVYDPHAGLLRFDEIRVRSNLLQVEASGVTQLEGLEQGWLSGMTGQFTFGDIAVAKGPMMERPIALSGAEVAFRLGLKPFRVDLGSLRITDPQFPVTATGWIEAAPEGWAASVDTQVARTTPQQVRDFWPAKLNPRPRKWVMENLLDGEVRDATFALRLEPGMPKPDTFLDLSFIDGRVTYAPGLPEVSGGAGRLTIYDGRLGLRLDRGHIDMGDAGEVALDGSVFVIPDLKQRPATGQLELMAEGPLEAVLTYVDNDKWRVLSKAGRTPQLATGRATVRGRVSIPLRKGLTFADTDLALTGQLSDLESDSIVPGRRLRGEALDVTLNNAALAVAGGVSFDGIPADGQWRQTFGGGGSTVTAKVTITPDSLATLGIRLPDGMLRGKGTGDLTLTLPPGGTPRFVVESDLAGLALAIPQIGWSMSSGTRGKFRVAGRLGTPVEIDEMTLTGGGLDADGRVVLNAAGAFDRLELTRLRVGKWLDVAGRLRARGRNAAPAVEITSGKVDLRDAPIGSGGAGGGGTTGGGAPITLALDSLRVTNTIELRAFRGNFDTTGGLSGNFSAQLGGEAPVGGEVVPQNGGSAFRIRGEDAGDILKAAGLLKTVQDGTFSLDLAPVRGQTGSFDGLLKVAGARLQKAPTIASLLDAISVVGILDQLNGPGIFFSDVEARFRLTPGQVILTQSSAVGPSMGISLDGYYNLTSGEMDMQGVLSPIYVVNAVGRLFSRKGEGLIGFNFTLGGTVADPSVSVNPLSALTPGMFRDIFRRPPPEL